MPEPFEQLDYIYMPSRDVAADTRHFTEALGAELVFAIQSGATRTSSSEKAMIGLRAAAIPALRP